MSMEEKRQGQAERLYEALGGVDPTLLERSEKRRKVLPIWRYGGMMAACLALCLVLAASWNVSRQEKSAAPNDTGAWLRNEIAGGSSSADAVDLSDTEDNGAQKYVQSEEESVECAIEETEELTTEDTNSPQVNANGGADGTAGSQSTVADNLAQTENGATKENQEDKKTQGSASESFGEYLPGEELQGYILAEKEGILNGDTVCGYLYTYASKEKGQILYEVGLYDLGGQEDTQGVGCSLEDLDALSRYDAWGEVSRMLYLGYDEVWVRVQGRFTPELLEEMLPDRKPEEIIFWE